MKTLTYPSILVATMLLSLRSLLYISEYQDPQIEPFILYDEHNITVTDVKKVEKFSSETPTQLKTSPKPCHSKLLKYIVDINDRIADENESAIRLIPNILHQTSRDRCVEIGVEKWIGIWRNSTHLPGINHFFYDDEDIESFLFDKERWESNFPSLHSALQCIDDDAHHNLREKVALWKYLILWEKGGMYSDLDTIPNARFRPTTIKPDDDAVLFHKRRDKENISETFLAVSPRHPLMFHAVNQRINRIFSKSTERNEKGDIHLALEAMAIDIKSSIFLEQKESIVIEGTGRSLRIFGGIDYRFSNNLSGGRGRTDRMFLRGMNMTIRPKQSTISTCAKPDTTIDTRPAEGVDFSQTRSYIVEERGEKLVPLPKSKSQYSFVLPDEITSLEILSENAKYLTPPKNLRLALIGDSLTRYQYIDLVYFLKFGKWNFDDKLIYGPYNGNWHNFFNYSKTALEPFEECDCSRPDHKADSLRYQCENRYYWDPVQNNSVSFSMKPGIHPFTSSWSPKEIHEPHDFDFTTRIRDMRLFPALNWTETVTKFISHMTPKPEIVIFNSGAWPHEDFEDKAVREEIVNAISDNGMISVYKTTTASKQDKILKDYEKEFCKITDYCFDLATWTAMINKQFFLDNVHFMPPTYSWMNIALMDLLATINKDRMRNVN